MNNGKRVRHEQADDVLELVRLKPNGRPSLVDSKTVSHVAQVPVNVLHGLKRHVEHRVQIRNELSHGRY